MGVHVPKNERRSAGTLTVALVERVFVVAGRPYIACMDPSSGQKWGQVSLPCGGGGSKRYVYTATAQPLLGIPGLSVETSEGAQALLVHTGMMRRPYCLGMIHHPNLEMKEIRLPVVLVDSDVDNAPYMTDHHMLNGGTHVIVDEYGAYTVDTTDAVNPHVRFQLSAVGVLRVARAGKSGDRTLLASASLAYHKKMEDHVAALTATVEALRALVTLQPVGTPLVTVAPLLALAPNTTTSTPTASTSGLRAATIHLPGDAEVD